MLAAAALAAVVPSPATAAGDISCESRGCVKVDSSADTFGWGVGLDEQSGKAYIGDPYKDRMWEVDLKSGRTSDLLNGGWSPTGVAVADPDTAYVAAFDEGNLYRVDLRRGTKEPLFKNGTLGQATGVALDGRTAYVTDRASDTLWAVDLDKPGRSPEKVADHLGDADGLALYRGKAYVADSWGDCLWEVDLNTSSKEKVAERLGDASGVAVDGNGQALVSDIANNKIYQVDLTSPRVTKPVSTVVSGPETPRHLTVDHTGHAYFVDTDKHALYYLKGLDLAPPSPGPAPGRYTARVEPRKTEHAAPGNRWVYPSVLVSNTGQRNLGQQKVVVTAPSGMRFEADAMTSWTQARGERSASCARSTDQHTLTCNAVDLNLNNGEEAVLYPRMSVASDAQTGPKDVTFSLGDPAFATGQATVDVTGNVG
ncbi:hypothetical protein [Streptomyces sp. NPDC016845]|uniref:hypothetical protein n=1 Tax=Streptomyces sp. NPDC016845 TaxID=3364972 RepID=UPI003798EE0C